MYCFCALLHWVGSNSCSWSGDAIFWAIILLQSNSVGCVMSVKSFSLILLINSLVNGFSLLNSLSMCNFTSSNGLMDLVGRVIVGSSSISSFFGRLVTF